VTLNDLEQSGRYFALFSWMRHIWKQSTSNWLQIDLMLMRQICRPKNVNI